ncbi:MULTISPECIES: exostosin domain-containing protein [Fischerella]|uniref:exostosin domain-containing protein n=1 Tax=Fischerella TaxID=1190 RepID=UPI0003034F2C|nr:MULTISPECIES: exostosin family protein [Fischerella]MBD2429779.1 exostosin family protein [Fischerella sp. FACHB-380]
MKIKIFSDPRYLPEGVYPVSLIQPFWSEYTKNFQLESRGYYIPPWDKLIANYAKISDSFFETTSLKEADFAVLPFDWLDVSGNTWTAKRNESAYALAIEFVQMVKQAGKPIIIFYCGDRSHEHIPIQDAFIFRQSLIGARRQSKEFVMTALYEDLVEYYLKNQLTIRQKQEKPIVGFDGCADQGNWSIKFKDLIRQGAMLVTNGETFPPYEGHRLRNQALKYLSNSPLVETNFKIRDKMAFFEAKEPEEKLKVRLEYVQNMVESNYILCCRGRGNFSLRFYETLCCGRIPIFVDTDCVLPYDFKIDWKKYCVWVDSKDLPQIAEKVAEFHNNLSPEQFVELQYDCRQMWKDWLSYEGFFNNFWQHFQL